MAQHYDVLVIDLDGTLLARNGKVSAANRRAVAAARDAGMDVVIATGRSLVESREALEAIEHDGIIVAAGGSLLCEAATGRTLDRRVLPADVVRDVTAPLLDEGHKVLILKDAHVTGYDYLAVGDGELDPASTWWFKRMNVQVRYADHLDEDEHPDDSVRAGAISCESKLAPLAVKLRQSLGDRCFLQHWSAVTETHAVGSQTHLLEVFTANVNKWTMIETYCRERGICPTRVAAIGDGLNDIDLMRHAGMSIAMENACPEVAALADYTTSHHDHDGVAHAIDRILEGTWRVSGRQ